MVDILNHITSNVIHCCCSVIQSCLTLHHHGLQHTRPSYSSPFPDISPSSYPLHLWCHLAISSSHALFFFFTQSFPEWGTFLMSQLFASDDWNTGASASASVLPTNIQNLFPLRLTGLISLWSKGLPGDFSSTTFQRHQFFSILPSLWSSSHNHTWPLGRPNPWYYMDLCWQRILLPFNTLSRFVIAFLSRSNHLLISWLHSPSAVILEPKNRKSVTTSTFPPSICHEVMGLDTMILGFSIFSFKLTLSPPSPSSKGSLVHLCFLPLEWYHLHIWICWYFSCLSWFQLVTQPAQYFSWCTLNIS